MNTKTCSFLAAILFSFSSEALETDNYLAWKVNLPDSRDVMNDFMAGKIQEALDKANAKDKTYSCAAITMKIAKQFKTTPTSKSIEEFVQETLDKEHIYPRTPKFLEESILNNTRFYLKYSGLSPNLQINGFYFGVDKLSHFASTGRRYFKHYLKKIKRGYSEEEAVESAIRYGLLNEASVLGWWASGVFSYGDMEANYQGFLYYKKMCYNGEDTYLSQDENGKWHLTLKPDLVDYVTQYWDETFNRSYFQDSSWPQVKETIRNNYCVMDFESNVADRQNYYSENDHTSYSLEYIKKLQAEGYRNAPEPDVDQSLEGLCEEGATVEGPLIVSEE